jgi:DnaK suppressor protein
MSDTPDHAAAEAALRALEHELSEALSSSRSHEPVALDQQAFGRVSRIDAIQQQQMAQAARRAQTLRLSQVRAALEALQNDEYGICRLCEEPIAPARLRARPETPLCLDCQKQRER